MALPQNHRRRGVAAAGLHLGPLPLPQAPKPCAAVLECSGVGGATATGGETCSASELGEATEDEVRPDFRRLDLRGLRDSLLGRREELRLVELEDHRRDEDAARVSFYPRCDDIRLRPK